MILNGVIDIFGITPYNSTSKKIFCIIYFEQHLN